MKGIYNWFGKHVNAPYGIYIFSLLVFIEGFFVVPTSTLLAFFCLKNRDKAILYGTIATIFSVLAALTGYYIGYLFWNALGESFTSYLISPAKFSKVVELYKHYQASAVFFTALTPMPFKALTLTAGFCKLPIITFLTYVFIARGIRFYCIAVAIYIWEDKVNYFLNKYFYYILTLGIAFFILMIWLAH